MNEAYIVSAVRTPIGRFGGALAELSPADLGAHAIKAALDKAESTSVSTGIIYFW